MAKKARQRISYVLELANSSRGHRLGVNGLAVDRDNAVLYSGGRDGVICAWDLGLDLSAPLTTKPPPTTFKSETLAHTHWINDICLAANNTAVVSASSDMMVKVWRPDSSEQTEPATIGQHADYAKCLASPGPSSDWVVSGGLDRKICLWDLNGAGSKLEIDAKGESVAQKGSVYALACASGGNVIASGSPESNVRLWDPRTGKAVIKFMGHTDVIRSVLISEAGDTVLSASSDSTVKLWSVSVGRCMYTFNMHNHSVWSLFSEDPRLGIFYSGDRVGLVAKTDVRGSLDELDDGLSLAVARENGGGILKLVAAGNHIWTATSNSSINRWANVDLDNVSLPEAWRHRPRTNSTGFGGRRHSSVPSITTGMQSPPPTGNGPKKEVPAKSILRISNTASFPPQLLHRDSEATSAGSIRRHGSEIAEVIAVEPIHHLPDETVEGQCGLLKHKLLNDRRRVLTVDTSGEVVLWDLIKCKRIKSFGKQNIDDVEPIINTLEAVAPWCSVDVSNGNLTVVLEPFNCFDAEMYADELEFDEPIEFREDQRINLGKWILRYLFDKLIDEELKRDEAYRARLNEHVERRLAQIRAESPTSIAIPSNAANLQSGSSVTTPRANGANPMTPGLAIASATPAPLTSVLEDVTSPASPGVTSQPLASGLPSAEKEDYFSAPIAPADGPKLVAAPTPAAPETPSEKPADKEGKDGNGKSPSTPFSKKFRMGMPSFSTMKLGRSASSSTEKPPPPTEEKSAEGDNSENSSNHEVEVDDCFLGAVQRIRGVYDRSLTDHPDKIIDSAMCPTLPSETPVLKLPPGLKIIIQEETSGGSVEVYKGSVETVGEDCDMIETKGPLWLGDALLGNLFPGKEPPKISFVLHPWQDSLPEIATADGNNRLNANRMLRVKKILAYVAERIDPQDTDNPDPDALKPEEYLELYCNDQLLPNNMSLATLRTRVWKGGNDIMLFYKANGRKEIPMPPPKPAAPEDVATELPAGEAPAAAVAAATAPPQTVGA